MTNAVKINRQDAYVSAVLETRDYGKFKRLQGNRDITEARKNRVRKSVLANGQVKTVIICNEKMEVIDGQARLEVFREMGLPVYYVVFRGLGARDCAILNASTTVWKITDYIGMYAELGNASYNRLIALQESHKDISLNTIMFAISGCISNVGKGDGMKINGSIKNGEFVLDADTARKADERLCYAERFLPGFRTTGRKELITSAAVFAYDVIPDREKLVDRWNKYSTLKSVERPAAAMCDVMKMLEACYNYRTNAKDSFYLAAEYERFAKARKARLAAK